MELILGYMNYAIAIVIAAAATVIIQLMRGDFEKVVGSAVFWTIILGLFAFLFLYERDAIGVFLAMAVGVFVGIMVRYVLLPMMRTPPDRDSNDRADEVNYAGSAQAPHLGQHYDRHH